MAPFPCKMYDLASSARTFEFGVGPRGQVVYVHFSGYCKRRSLQ